MSKLQPQRMLSRSKIELVTLMAVIGTAGCGNASEGNGESVTGQTSDMPSNTNTPAGGMTTGPVNPGVNPPSMGGASGGSGPSGPVSPPGNTGPTGPSGPTGPAGDSGGASGGTGSGDAPGPVTAGAGGSSGAAGSDNSSEGGSSGAVAGGAVAGGAGQSGDAGGSAVDPGDDSVMASSGCGQDPPASERYSIDVDGLMREYILYVPENYDPNKPYRLIFGWHPWGGSAQQVAGNGPSGYYGLQGASGGEAILVSGEGLDFGGNGLGWGNEGGQDIAFLRAMIDRFDSELCFDHNRMFSTGFSFGGMMSNAVACAGLARAVAPMAGNSMVAGCEDGTQPVAYMGFHGDVDSVVAISGGEAARDVFIERNGCGAATPSDSDWCDLAGSNYQPCTCTTYEGCEEGYPVTWCQFSGNHMPAPNSGETIWNFFSQF